MLGSVLLYAGLAAALLGALSLIHPLRFLGVHTRKTGVVVLASGLLIAGAAAAFPVTEKRVGRRSTLLDDAMPVWQFAERHAIEVDATPERVFDAIHAVTADEIFLFRTLIGIRRLGRRGPESILNAPERQSLLDVATRTTFVTLADVRPREVVVGTLVAAPRRARATGRLTPDLFYKKLQPGIALATMNFLVTPLTVNRSVVTTETRIFANTPATARRFAIYWRLIHPGSDIIRRMWLRAIRCRAEGSDLAAAEPVSSR
jgi:hypothetical protein